MIGATICRSSPPISEIHLDAMGWAEMEEAGKRLAIAIVVMLISLIGGRIVSSFTTNWLRRRQADDLPVPFGRRTTLGLNALALAIWTAVGLNAISGMALIVASLTQAIRLGRWRGAATTAGPLLWILHIGYAWLPIGLGLLAAAAWKPISAPSRSMRLPSARWER